jgi:hypothetical protein
VTAIYPAAKAALLRAEVNFMVDAVAAVMVDGYTYNAAHTSLTDVLAFQIGDPELLDLAVTASGTVTVDPFTFTTPPAGHVVDALVIYVDTGITPDLLIAHIDRSVGALPMAVNTNDGDVTFTFSPLLKL